MILREIESKREIAARMARYLEAAQGISRAYSDCMKDPEKQRKKEEEMCLAQERILAAESGMNDLYSITPRLLR